MQLRKTNLLLAALFATGLMLTACGDDNGGDGNALCAQDSECGDNEICSAGFCMQKCDSAADCPDTNKNCVAQSATSTQKVCKCQTDSLCQGDSGNADLKCDASSGACTTTGTSNPTPTSCTGTGKDVCAYGYECVSGTCTALATGTCSNIASAKEPTSSYEPKTWTPTISNQGPVIYEVTQTTYATDASFCPSAGSYHVVARVNAYGNSGFTFPSTKTGLGNFFYAQTSGQTQPVCTTDTTGCVGVTNYSSATSGTTSTAQFDVNFCWNQTTLQIGLFFVNGNGACKDLAK
jgi:hypothetical protein